MCRINKQGGNRHLKNVTQTQQQRPGLPMVTLTWHVSKCKVQKLHPQQGIYLCWSYPEENVPLVFTEDTRCQVRVTVGNSGLCCYFCVTSFKH